MKLGLSFVFFLLAGMPVHAQQSESLDLHFFGSSTCGECLEIKEKILKPLESRHSGKLSINYHDVEEQSGLGLMLEMERKFNLKTSSAQELFFPDTVLLGFQSIMESAPRMIEHYLAHPEKWAAYPIEIDSTRFSESIKQKFNQFTFLGILAAGLVDGINPCAIATMIFLISFLATQKRNRSEVLAIGLSFTAAVFATYLLLGVGAFKMLTALEPYYWVSRGIRWSAVGVAGILGVVSYWDAIRFRKTRKAQDIKLQLPKAIKLRIHKVIAGNLSGKQLVFGAIVTGFLVTLLEAVCTGQVYIPTIVLMTRQSGLRLAGWLYLIFYNFLFVLPLLAVMILAYFGLKWDKLAKTTQTHLPALKIGLGTVLLALASFLAIAG